MRGEGHSLARRPTRPRTSYSDSLSNEWDSPSIDRGASIPILHRKGAGSKESQ